MVTPWRFSVRLCLSRLRCFELGKELGLLRPSGCSRNARLCWLLLGTLPKLISAYGDINEGTPDSLCRRRARWSDPAEGGPVQRISQAGRLGCVFLHLRVWLRAGILLVKFFPLLLLYPLTYLAPSVSTLWLRLLLKATETSGPTYIKLGQWASTRRDLFSEAFCAQFSKLHVRVTPHPWTHTEHFLQQAFGEDWGSLLSFENQEPVGSGCVAQVYKAYANTTFLENDSLQRLGGASCLQPSSEAAAVRGLRELFGHPGKGWKPPGSLADQSFLERLLLPKADLVGLNAGVSQASVSGPCPKPDHLIPVAVKVLHPGLLAQVHVDLLLMKIGSRVLGLLPGIKWLSLPEIVEEFEKLMIQQIDLRYEARNLEHFQRNFQNVKAVKFPTPLHPFVTRDVLVETYEGQRVAELILHHARANECRDVEGFKAEMATLVTQARKNTITLEKVKLESNFASIVFAIMVLEGLGRSLDPNLDILEAAKPFLLKGPASSP
ncbi:putative aarF domain-containing protein kinase 2 [Daubentonia madagascariensis]|uniref:AarF domain-containing protein kinase 2 n=1 Tax=Daubentonia madagascariensis TaxID=31869 RepID=A0ABD2EEY8_DAUMA